MKALKSINFYLTSASAAVLLATVPGHAMAQAAPDNGSAAVDEIIVTARKRQESILNVPVVATAVSEERLERLQTTGITDLPKLVPGLNLGNSLLSIGTQVSIRGVGTASQDPGVDQSVSLNIDGLSLGQGLAFQSGMFDLQQIEVFKGPQALFYGKSSPGGVISIRTADPTSELKLLARVGYEFEANTTRLEGIVSGPVTDDLKLRLAAMYSDSDGYFRNRAVAALGTGARDPAHRHAPGAESYIVRGTAVWNPTNEFDARLKVNFVHDRLTNPESFQITSCPGGTSSPLPFAPFLGGEDCRLDRTMRVVDMDPAAFPGVMNNGTPFLRNNQKFGTLELNYRFRPELTLTSTTALYGLRSKSLVNMTQTTAAGPWMVVENHFRRDEFTQEFRLNSDFASPVNFTAGAFYQDGEVRDNVTFIGNRAYSAIIPPSLLDSNGVTTVDIRTYSAFGQLRWNILPRLELAGGLRWTDEERKQHAVDLVTGATIDVLTPRIQSDNIAPELTLTWSVNDDVTLFGALKKGYKSGSFSIATVPTPTIDNSFGDEKVEGGEFGVKSRLLNRRLSLNVAYYDYRYRGLQVGAVEPAENGAIVIRTVNAGSARTRGVDADATYRPEALPGLGLNASVNYNEGQYNVLNNVPCYAGQTSALGCVGGVQDLSGTPMIRAPKWQASFGFDYERSVGGGLTLVLSNNNQFSSRYVTTLANRPNNDQYQQGFIKTDVSLVLRGPEDGWELALIGKNITDRLTTGNCSASDYRSGVVIPSGSIAAMGCYIDPGREVWVRLTYRPSIGR